MSIILTDFPKTPRHIKAYLRAIPTDELVAKFKEYDALMMCNVGWPSSGGYCAYAEFEEIIEELKFRNYKKIKELQKYIKGDENGTYS